MWEASRWKTLQMTSGFSLWALREMRKFSMKESITKGWMKNPRQYRGQTGAQDNIIPTMDIFSGVINHYPSNELTRYLLDLRAYRPVCVQRFFEDLKEDMKQLHPQGLTGWLNERRNEDGLILLLGILEEIYFFRNGHWQFVQKYIMPKYYLCKSYRRHTHYFLDSQPNNVRFLMRCKLVLK